MAEDQGSQDSADGPATRPRWRQMMCRMQSEQRKRRMLPQGSIALFNFSDLAEEVVVRTRRPTSRTNPSVSSVGANGEPQQLKKVTFKNDKCNDPELEEENNNLYILFNFVEISDPPPAFPSFKDGFMHVARVVRQHHQFRLGVLLKDVDPKGRFPYLKYEIFQADGDNIGIRHEPSWLKVIREGFGDLQIHHQAGFLEVESLWMVDTTQGDWMARRPIGDDTVFIMTAFKADGDLNRLEKKWRRWSGADFILCSMPKDLKLCLRRITFHKRVVPKGSFMYVLLCELISVRAFLYKVKDFVLRLNHRQCGYSAAYTVEEDYSK